MERGKTLREKDKEESGGGRRREGRKVGEWEKTEKSLVFHRYFAIKKIIIKIKVDLQN